MLSRKASQKKWNTRPHQVPFLSAKNMILRQYTVFTITGHHLTFFQSSTVQLRRTYTHCWGVPFKMSGAFSFKGKNVTLFLIISHVVYLSLAKLCSPGLAMLLRTVTGSFLLHFCSSSCIFSTLAGLSAHRQPFRDEFPFLFSTFSKHLFKERLWRMEFFQPSGAVWSSKDEIWDWEEYWLFTCRTWYHVKVQSL